MPGGEGPARRASGGGKKPPFFHRGVCVEERTVIVSPL